MKKLHYSWYMIFIGGLLMFGMSAQQMSHGVFLARVADTLGVGMGSISLAYSVSSYLMIILAPLAANLFSNYPIRPLCLIAAAAQTGSLILLSYAQNLYMVACACVLESFTVSCFLGVLSSTLIKRWFKDRGQFAYNIILFLSMMGGVIFTPIASAVIEALSWRIAYRILAAFILAVEMPVVFFFMKNSPDQIGLKPYEDAGAVDKKKIQKAPTMNADLTVKSAWKSGTFYLVCLYALALGYSGSMQNHLVRHLENIGFASVVGATAVSAGMFGGLIGRVFLSFISEKYGLRISNLIYCGIGIISAIALCNGSGKTATVIIAWGLLYGLAVKVSTVLTSLMKYRVFSASVDYTKIVANVNVVTMIATASSSTVFGFIYDLTGTYTPVFVIVIITFIVGIFLSNVLLKKDE